MNRKSYIILAGLVVIVVLLFVAGWGSADGKLHVYFLDIGQGDAMLLVTPRGHQVLIDGGPDDTVLRRLGEVMPFYDKSLDLVVATHEDADHIAGLVSVLDKYQVGQIWETGMACATATCRGWQDREDKEGASITYAKRGQEIDLEDGVKLILLYPFNDERGQVFKKRNDGAIVLKLIYGSQSVLFTADVEKNVEAKLITTGMDLKADFLKVGHHGSKTSTTENFLKAVSPQVAFIEVGARNRYGHPTEQVLSRLENYGIKYYRTDTDGTKELILDGKNYLIK